MYSIRKVDGRLYLGTGNGITILEEAAIPRGTFTVDPVGTYYLAWAAETIPR